MESMKSDAQKRFEPLLFLKNNKLYSQPFRKAVLKSRMCTHALVPRKEATTH
jgi:hypothetical protein